MTSSFAVFAPLPSAAAWRHQLAREGFEVVYLEPRGAGYRMVGSTAAVEDGQPWVVDYEIDLDDRWATRHADVAGRSEQGTHRVRLDADGTGRWWVDGERAAHLDGCLDVDLESSALTNAFPVHRLGLGGGEAADAPAAYVRAVDQSVERLDQHYSRITDGGRGPRYTYAAPTLDFTCRLAYDEAGLVMEYPGIAVRHL